MDERKIVKRHKELTAVNLVSALHVTFPSFGLFGLKGRAEPTVEMKNPPDTNPITYLN